MSAFTGLFPSPPENSMERHVAMLALMVAVLALSGAARAETPAPRGAAPLPVRKASSDSTSARTPAPPPPAPVAPLKPAPSAEPARPVSSTNNGAQRVPPPMPATGAVASDGRALPARPREGARGPAIDGRYRYLAAGQTHEVRVERLTDVIYRLVSTEGWEGAGILDGSTYRGVYHSLDGRTSTVGRHWIDWSNRNAPDVRANEQTANATEIRRSWERIEEGSASPLQRGAVTPPTPGDLPKFGEYVQVDELPEAVTKVAPTYPEDARREGIDGTVLVQALVLRDGAVAETRVMKSIPALDAAAVDCVRQWRFKPALKDGRPVAVWLAVPIRFSLH